MFAARYQLKRITVAILNCAAARHSKVYAALWTEKLNLLNSVSIEIMKFLRYQKLQHVFECCLSAFTQSLNRFATRLALQMIRCSKSSQKSAVQSLLLWNHTAGSKSIQELFSIMNWKLNKVCLYKKIIRERCEFVRLCHINLSGPVFWDTLYIFHLLPLHIYLRTVVEDFFLPISTFSALGVSHVMRSINVRYLLTYLLSVNPKLNYRVTLPCHTPLIQTLLHVLPVSRE